MFRWCRSLTWVNEPDNLEGGRICFVQICPAGRARRPGTSLVHGRTALAATAGGRRSRERRACRPPAGTLDRCRACRGILT